MVYLAMSKKIEITEAEYAYLTMCKDALMNFAIPKCVCPNCGEALILAGYCCFNCGYDYTAESGEIE